MYDKYLRESILYINVNTYMQIHMYSTYCMFIYRCEEAETGSRFHSN